MQKDMVINLVRKAASMAGGNFRKFTYKICDPAKGGESMIGMVDYTPVEGTVMLIENGILVIKEGRQAKFAAYDVGNLSMVPEVGDKVRVTSYQRRRFDGKFLTDPVEESVSGSGFVSHVYHLGEQVSKIPGISKDNSVYLQQMAKQLENLKVDSRRRITQFLIDCGANEFPVEITDVDADPDNDHLPMITFGFNSQGHQGRLSVALDRGADSYTITVNKDGAEAVVLDEIYFDQLAEAIAEMIPHNDDWIIDRVEVLKKATKKKAG